MYWWRVRAVLLPDYCNLIIVLGPYSAIVPIMFCCVPTVCSAQAHVECNWFEEMLMLPCTYSAAGTVVGISCSIFLCCTECARKMVGICVLPIYPMRLLGNCKDHIKILRYRQPAAMCNSVNILHRSFKCLKCHSLDLLFNC